MNRWLLIACALMLGSSNAVAQTTDRVPHINDEGQRIYRSYLNQGFYRAFVISEGGGYGSGYGYSSIEEATKTATASCQRRDPSGVCKPYSLNGYVVWDRDATTIPRYAAAPKLGRFIPSDYYPVQGPTSAKGLVIWSHGYFRGIDATTGQPHGYISRLHAAGWDVYRYNREWVNQLHDDIQGMIDSVAAAKAAGYEKVILAGQSQGAWVSLEALADGAKADGVIATAMARHGAPPSSGARSDFRQLLRDIRSRNAPAPIVVSLFQDDAYDPGGRFADVPDVLGGSQVTFHLIDRPAELPGHGAGANYRFNDRFGACILRFMTTTPPVFGDCK